jgi:phosphodiesterase/alkaline phosphatase D-like protein
MQKRIRLLGVALVLLASLTACTTLQPDTSMPQNDTKTDVHEQTAFLQPAEQVSAAEANSSPVSVILGRPTASEITASILTRVSAQVTLQWGETSGAYTSKSDPVVCDGVDPAVFVLDGLKANTRYYYQVGWQADGKELVLLDEASFHTARATGETYQFVIQSDSHLKNKADEDLYAQSMANMAALQPDFMFDLGDAFINDLNSKGKAAPYETIAGNYRAQLPYFSIAAKSAPLFLTIGNHEGEYGSVLNGEPDNLAITSTKARTLYFPNPVPNAFYSGNTELETGLGAPENYYAFTWGDALFVSIDPYRYSTIDPYGKGSGWDWTLGKTQYDWFRNTLENSNAKYKFVFSHHAFGNIRGGAEIAKLYEWGGYDKNGTYRFDEMRPGWGKPIQQVMAENHVTVFFQGHDHLFAREVVDGVVYQTLPKPAEREPDAQNNFASYPNADLLMNSGFLNVTVAPESVTIEYVRNYYVSTDAQQGNTGVVYRYAIDTAGNVTVLLSHKDDTSTYPTAGKGDKQGKTGNGNKEKAPSETATLPEEPSTAASGAQPLSSPTELSDGAFAFCLEADPHWDEKADAALFQTSITKIAALKPSFLIDLGDLSMVEKLCRTQQEVEARYTYVKAQFLPLGEIPLYLVPGNHDGETGWSGELARWAREARLAMFPPETQTGDGLTVSTGNYYSFTMGNALFVVLDPYTFTTEQVGKSGNGWASTLGEAQYRWLEQTLQSSDAKWKFVFIHNLVGGIGKDQRGGAEAAQYFEWGGLSADGTDQFDLQRIGWGKPIRELLATYGVNAVFHGHDHFYAHQVDGGIVYQLVPQPATAGNSVRNAADYGYFSGTFLPSPGFLRVVVAPEQVTVEYWLQQKDGSFLIVDAYTIPGL